MSRLVTVPRLADAQVMRDLLAAALPPFRDRLRPVTDEDARRADAVARVRR